MFVCELYKKVRNQNLLFGVLPNFHQCFLKETILYFLHGFFSWNRSVFKPTYRSIKEINNKLNLTVQQQMTM